MDNTSSVRQSCHDPRGRVANFLDDMDAKMQSIRSELERNVAQGRPADQFTEWVRPLERALLDSSAYLAEEPIESQEK